MLATIAGALLIGLGALAIVFNAYVWWRRGISSRPVSGFPVIGGVLAAWGIFLIDAIPLAWAILPLVVDTGGFAGLILEPWQKQRIEDAAFRDKVNAEAPEPITGPLNWSLLDPGPPIEPAAIQAAEEAVGMPIPADLIRFLEETGNGGYLRDYICFPIPPECGHTFHLRSLIGIGHPNGNHDLVTNLENYSYDAQLAPRLIPVFEDDFGAKLCMTESAQILFWEPEGGPEDLTPVADSLAELVAKSFRCSEQ